MRKLIGILLAAVAATFMVVTPANAANIYPCVAENGTDIPLHDNFYSFSGLSMPAACVGPMSNSVTVEVRIDHTYIGQLMVQLQEPNGEFYTLHQNTGGSNTRLYASYVANFSRPLPNIGLWRLYVTDNGIGHTGKIDWWKLTVHQQFATSNCVRTLTGPITLERNADLTLPISGCAGKAAQVATVELISGGQFWLADLIAPDGSRYGIPEMKSNRVVQLDLSAENANGSWRIDFGGDVKNIVSLVKLNLNGTSVAPIRDQQLSMTVHSHATNTSTYISNAGGTGSYWSTVSLTGSGFPHWYLLVDLISSDGSRYRLLDGDLDWQPRQMQINLTDEQRYGTWKLEVKATYAIAGTGTLNWHIVF